MNIRIICRCVRREIYILRRRRTLKKYEKIDIFSLTYLDRYGNILL